jgi:membrane-associated protein
VLTIELRPVFPLLAADLGTTWWQYVLLFMAVAASWAGVPFIGSAALGAAAVGASQGKLDLDAVVAVATLGGEVGGLIGYFIGGHWGRRLLARPGKHKAGRQKLVEKGEVAYARWGRLAVFFTPAIISGTAEMPRGQFVLWNLIASFGWTISVALSAYGVGRLLSDHHRPLDIIAVIVGIAAGALITWITIRRHRRRAAAQAESAPETTEG